MDTNISLTAIATVALLRLKGVGRRAAVRIIQGAINSEEQRHDLFDRAARAKLNVAQLGDAWREAEDQLDKSRSAGIEAYAFFDRGFPARLRNIPDPPAVLYVKGATASLHSDNALAVVGTREPTDYGERVAFFLASAAVREGYTIVSGLAHGCDAFAHQGCVQENGVGVAVMAHGLDKVYPAANKALAQRLLDTEGALVSEYPIGMTPARTAFAERDRLQSGLSDAVLVIETDVKGGTMHTVNFSRQQKRPLACINHPEQWRKEPKTRGNQALIAEKWAEPIANGDDLVAFLDKLKGRRETVGNDPDNSDPQISMGF